MFFCEFCKIFKNTFFTEHLWWLLLKVSSFQFLSISGQSEYVNEMLLTAWKVSVFGDFLVCIFPHSDWIRTRKTPNTDTFQWLTLHFKASSICNKAYPKSKIVRLFKGTITITSALGCISSYHRFTIDINFCPFF